MESLRTSTTAIMEKYLADEDIAEADLRAALRRATHRGAGSAGLLRQRAEEHRVQPLMNGVAHFLPSPEESRSQARVLSRMEEAGSRTTSSWARLQGPFRGGAQEDLPARLQRARGREQRGLELAAGALREIHKLYTVHANRYEPIAEARAGEIVLATASRNASRRTRCSQGKASLRLENIDVLQPVLNVALVPAAQATRKNFKHCLKDIASRTRPLRSFTDEDTDQLIVAPGRAAPGGRVGAPAQGERGALPLRQPSGHLQETVEAGAEAEGPAAGSSPTRCTAPWCAWRCGRASAARATRGFGSPGGQPVHRGPQAMEDARRPGRPLFAWWPTPRPGCWPCPSFEDGNTDRACAWPPWRP